MFGFLRAFNRLIKTLKLTLQGELVWVFGKLVLDLRTYVHETVINIIYNEHLPVLLNILLQLFLIKYMEAVNFLTLLAVFALYVFRGSSDSWAWILHNLRSHFLDKVYKVRSTKLLVCLFVFCCYIFSVNVDCNEHKNLSLSMSLLYLILKFISCLRFSIFALSFCFCQLLLYLLEKYKN